MRKHELPDDDTASRIGKVVGNLFSAMVYLGVFALVIFAVLR
jgi:hypothetical protein